MNDTNNNLNGTILGNVNNENNNVPTNENVEMLDVNVNSNPSQIVNDNNIVNQQNTYFNNNAIDNQNSNQTVSEASQVMADPMPQVEPTPAFTSLQSINPAPMPGFENSGTIGTTPPMSLEPEKQPKKKNTNKILFIILVLIVLAGVGFGTYYILNYTDILNKKSEVKIETKDLEINVGDTLSDKIGDYATITGTDVKNCSLDKTEVVNDKEGEYTYKITCGNKIESGKIVVIDNKELEVSTKTVYKAIGATLDVNEFINERNSEYTYEFVDAETVQGYLNAEGTYNVKLKIKTDKKETETDAKLVVVPYEIRGYLTCESSGQNLDGTSAQVINSLSFAISKDTANQNIYGKVAFETYKFKYSDETEYANLLAEYKSNKKITINNISGQTEFDDTTLTISITNDKDNQSLMNEYGQNVLEKYSTIKTYFEGTKGYTCSYKIEGM